MTLCRSILALAAALLMAVSACQCEPLDQGLVEKIYFNGDLEKVIEVLEKYRSTEPLPDSASAAFMYKYLGVVYSSIPDTRDKGESFFYQLVKLDPEATLIDMYVSSEIEGIFEKLKAEHNRRLAYERKKRGEVNAMGRDAAAQGDKGGIGDSGKGKPRPAGGSGGVPKWVWWTAGGAAVAGAVTAFVVMGGGEDAAAERKYGGTVRPEL